MIIAIAIGVGTTLGAQLIGRFSRQPLSHLDSTTTVDVVRDGYTGRCQAVYRVEQRRGAGVDAGVAVTSWEVPCVPTASAVR